MGTFINRKDVTLDYINDLVIKYIDNYDGSKINYISDKLVRDLFLLRLFQIGKNSKKVNEIAIKTVINFIHFDDCIIYLDFLGPSLGEICWRLKYIPIKVVNKYCSFWFLNYFKEFLKHKMVDFILVRRKFIFIPMEIDLEILDALIESFNVIIPYSSLPSGFTCSPIWNNMLDEFFK